MEKLTEDFFVKAAGWQAMKQARQYLAQDRVLSSDWSPPLLKGIVQAGTTTFKSGLVIKNPKNIDNLCTCRESRQWGTLCAHSVAVALHHIHGGVAPGFKKDPSSSQNTPAAEQPSSAHILKPAFPRVVDPDPGVPLHLHLILPPNLVQAAGKGKAMLVFEAEWNRQRAPLDTVPDHETYQISQQDAAILAVAENLAHGKAPAMLLLDTRTFAQLLPLLAHHPRVHLGKKDRLDILDTPFQLRLRATLEPDGEIQFQLRGPAPAILGPDLPWVLHEGRLQPLKLSPTLLPVLHKPLRLSRQEIPHFLTQEWNQLESSHSLETNFTPQEFEFLQQDPAMHLHLTGGLAMLQAKLTAVYPDLSVSLPDTAMTAGWQPDPASPTRYVARNTTAEQNALNTLVRNGFSKPDSKGLLHLNGQEAVLRFLSSEYPRLQREWNISLEERLERSANTKLERIEPRFEITPSGVQWFDFSVSYQTSSGESLSPAEIQRLLRSGRNHTQLSNGKMAVLDSGAVEELQEVLQDCSPEQQSSGRYRMHKAQAGFLSHALRQQSAWKVNAPQNWLEQAAQMRGETKPTPPPLGALENILRPYQKEGIAWMHFLRQNGFGGVLADEMGLGKTLQTLAFLQSLQTLRSPSERKLPHLVVCPTSLVHNWAAESEKFTPNLKILVLHGQQRAGLFPRIPDSDLVITSYALIRRDADRYRPHEFDTVTLDEAQHIKNRQTQNAQAVKAIRSQHQLVLTGTPLENSVLDLWSIFDFLMPGYLGGHKDFRERYEIPIAKEKSRAAMNRLNRRVRPFLLRRTKKEVAPDLPEKLDQIAWCELSREQSAIYRQVLEAGRREVLEAAGAEGTPRSRMAVLNALLRLRQACCDLRLLPLTDSMEPARSPSGKMEMFGELLQEILDGNHRALVFSQFVEMLQLLKRELEAQEIPYCYLDGSTRNRAEVVDQFQEDDSIPFFLISLKAGGTGLNLTGADTVIHFDPWWNPATEAQATDRTHRIGQTRMVTSYKLIMRDTVEEKILQLQSKKREMIEGTLGDEQQLASLLTWEEIQELLS